MEEGSVRIQTEVNIVIQVMEKGFLAFCADNKHSHIWRLLAAIKHAQKTATTSPAPILFSLTNFVPYQKTWTNMAIMMNWAKPEVHP